MSGTIGSVISNTAIAAGQVLRRKADDSGWESAAVAGGITLLDVYPVGSIYISIVSTDPGTLFGGTWAAFGAGKVLVGLDSGDVNFDVVEETGGAKTVQSSAQSFAGDASTSIVDHTHDTVVKVGTTDGTYGVFDSSSTSPGTDKTITTGNPKSGGVASYTPTGTNTPGAATSVVQPYIVVYMWKRTA
jgi:LysM repeat protein